MRLGIADHRGWAVAVTATGTHQVVDRRRIELIEPDVPQAPFEHDGKTLSDAAALGLIRLVQASIGRAASAALDDLGASLSQPISAVSLRMWPADFPRDIATRRRAPYDTRTDSVMYREVLAELAEARGWTIHLYDARRVEAQAAAALGPRARDVLYGPRATLGPPWGKDQRMALAATVLSG